MKIKKRNIRIGIIAVFYILLAGAFAIGVGDGVVITQTQLNNFNVETLNKSVLNCQRDAPDAKTTLGGAHVWLVNASCQDLFSNGDGTYNVTRVDTDVFFYVQDYKGCLNDRYSGKNWTVGKIKQKCDDYYTSVLRGGIEGHVQYVKEKILRWQTTDYDMGGYGGDPF